MSDKKYPQGVYFKVPKTIVLVGLMGAGKTSIGRRLAKQLELPFFDTDQEVEQAAGMSIKDIYEVYGEDTFKDAEKKVITRLIAEPVHVMATGGGSFSDEENRALIHRSTITVWLKADLETLVARVSKRDDRPLLLGVDQREVLARLIDERYPYFEGSDIIVPSIDEPTFKTVDRVLFALEDHLKQNGHKIQYYVKDE